MTGPRFKLYIGRYRRKFELVNTYNNTDDDDDDEINDENIDAVCEKLDEGRPCGSNDDTGNSEKGQNEDGKKSTFNNLGAFLKRDEYYVSRFNRDKLDK